MADEWPRCQHANIRHLSGGLLWCHDCGAIRIDDTGPWFTTKLEDEYFALMADEEQAEASMQRYRDALERIEQFIPGNMRSEASRIVAAIVHDALADESTQRGEGQV